MASEPSNIEDQLLVMDAQDGDARAIKELVSRWQKRLWRYAFRLTANEQAAWDVTQQSWLGIIRDLGKLHDPANFKAWAYRITTNRSIDWMRESHDLKQVSIEEIQHVAHKEKESTGIRELLRKLDMKKRVVLSLYYFEQLTVSEISIALSIPKGTVKSRLHSARRELKELWKQHFE